MNGTALEPIAVGKGSLGKTRGIVDAFDRVWSGSVLDVGCRSREMERALQGRSVAYVGLDINPPADLVADLGKGLPLADDEFDVVVALDVLEHTDDIHLAFGELCRVARSWVVISLPNAFELRIRLRHLFGQPLSGKYGLPTEKPEDRHRWFFSLDEARRFLMAQAPAAGWTPIEERFIAGPRLQKVGPLAGMRPNLLASTYVALLAPINGGTRD